MTYGPRVCQVLFCGDEAKVESDGHHHCRFHWMNRQRQQPFTYKAPGTYPYVPSPVPRNFKIVFSNHEG